ncbi:phosphoribosyltransferase [Ketogulonicigenium robustum]|uniref:Phosphoribosyltransferase n=1 Tax=Ketogulonicigenium robustum TaxID=92947 RepID=A0A1W6NZH6_9RHOB|nr:phosphoribosyltransferase [Ketogulonicigenium robustum]ARO14662.1 phosphoribosyltransferase [Ketogulonicigenium robustum]
MRTDVWQQLYTDLTLGVQADQDSFAVALGDRQILLPIRKLPDGRGVASLILNQAGFSVLDALADAVAAGLHDYAPEVVVAVPTLGLPLAEAVARRLGHNRLVPLGYSRKFWYDEALSLPLSSITTPGGGKRLYIDPRMLALLQGKRVVVVDDVLSSGASIATVLKLMDIAGVAPLAVGAAMLQGDSWRGRLSLPVIGAFSTPILHQGAAGWAVSPQQSA